MKKEDFSSEKFLFFRFGENEKKRVDCMCRFMRVELEYLMLTAHRFSPIAVLLTAKAKLVKRENDLSC